MVRIIISIFLFISFSSKAQMPMFHGHNFTAQTNNLLLDDYPGAKIAYSIRKLDKDYTGALIRVRRSSDNTEQDIYPITDDVELDTAAIQNFGGSGSCFVTTIYDQSGNGENMTQTSATVQGAIMISGVIQRQNGKPAIYYDGGDYYTNQDTIGTALAGYITYFLVGKNDGSNDEHFIDGQQANTRNIIGVSGGNLVTFAGLSVLSFGANNTNYNLHYLLLDLSATNVASLARNNATAVTGTAGRENLRNPILGAGSGGFGYFPITGYISEWVAWESNVDRTGVSNNINSYYSIY